MPLGCSKMLATPLPSVMIGPAIPNSRLSTALIRSDDAQVGTPLTALVEHMAP